MQSDCTIDFGGIGRTSGSVGGGVDVVFSIIYFIFTTIGIIINIISNSTTTTITANTIDNNFFLLIYFSFNFYSQ